MASAAELAALMTAGINNNPASNGGEDFDIYTGQVTSWDDSTGINTVTVNGTSLTNLDVVQSGIGIAYSAGDIVTVMRKQSKYWILGRVGAPGRGAANQIKAAVVNTGQSISTVGWSDLATPGPTVEAYIGSSRRALVFANSGVDSQTLTANTYSGGWLTLSVTGASTIVPGPGASLPTPFYATGFIDYEGDMIGTFSQTWVVTAADGLNSGFNTFTLKYSAAYAGIAATFSGRAIAVIPF